MWERLLDQMLRRLVRKGGLKVTYPSGDVRRYGEDDENPVAVRVADAATLRRIVLNAELAVGEAYMDERLLIENDDLYGFLGLVISNAAEEDANVWWRRVVGALRNAKRRLDQWNPVGTAQRNVAHHYDLSGELYRLFLDADRQYSCAYFTRPDMTLDEAQEAKKHHIARKLCLEPGMRVLDIGCGWGGMGLTLARDYGCEVLGVTLSTEQHRVANARAEAEGLSDRARFELVDYRRVTGTFDRVVSVGMFEHVGVPHYREYFRHVHDFLTPDGVALIHTIGRTSPPGTTNPWIRKYIFPGGYIPAMSEVMEAVEKERFWTCDVEVLRLHYAETLKHWYDRFMANIERVREIYDDRFCRMWRWYLVASELTFRFNHQVVFQFQLARRQEAVPLIRDYLYRPPSGEPARPKTTSGARSARRQSAAAG
ncbi:MAG: class I SAM-dependent methyltransferase [Alphaproteobacteria bacterium]|nr:MAG: class I SAM-dependent methyltransferase [Alphaproteobacteria bacterium]